MVLEGIKTYLPVLCPKELGLVTISWEPKNKAGQTRPFAPMAGQTRGSIPFVARVLLNCCQPLWEIQWP